MAQQQQVTTGQAPVAAPTPKYNNCDDEADSEQDEENEVEEINDDDLVEVIEENEPIRVSGENEQVVFVDAVLGSEGDGEDTKQTADSASPLLPRHQSK